MKALLQRVLKAWVEHNGKEVASIDQGLLIFLGVQKGDDEEKAKRLADQCSAIRIFEDRDGKMNHSLRDINGQALVVSQFTLIANTKKGNRPSFTDAEGAQKANHLYEKFIVQMSKNSIPTQKGIFGARMKVGLENDGPVTIMVEI